MKREDLSDIAEILQILDDEHHRVLEKVLDVMDLSNEAFVELFDRLESWLAENDNQGELGQADVARSCPLCDNAFKPNESYSDGTFEKYCRECSMGINSFQRGSTRDFAKTVSAEVARLKNEVRDLRADIGRLADGERSIIT